jgi:hypothetical protein
MESLAADRTSSAGEPTLEASGGISRPSVRTRVLSERVPAWVITAVAGLVYVISAPSSTDLAAAAYRSGLFSTGGLMLWDNGWYAGHALPAYSILAPALGAWIGPQLVAALAMVAATALFALLIDGVFPARAARIAELWFAVGASVSLLANRVPFDLGLALGLGCLLAARRRRYPLGLLLAALTALASPVAAAFLALVLLAWALVSRRGSRGRLPAWPLALLGASLAPVALLALVFPEGGIQPFAGSAFFPALAGVLVIAALIVRKLQTETGLASGSARVDRALLAGALLYAVALTLAYAIPTAVGGNADRLGALLAGPLAACILLPRYPRALLILAPFLLYWQANAPVADFASAAGDPAVRSSYYEPLLHELSALRVGYAARPARIEIVPTVDHWEARWVAPHVAIARGWERQLDDERNALFYEGSTPLSARRYRSWLAEQGISYVALPDAPLDYSATAEARLLRGIDASGRSRLLAGSGASATGASAYLREVWHSAHWRLFAVTGASPLAQPPAVLTQLGSQSFTLWAPRPGAFTVRVRFTPYWALARGAGCVLRAPGDWTEVQARSAGSLHAVIDFSLARIFEHGPRCS